MPIRHTLVVLTLLLAACADAQTPAYFDDFSYTRVGTRSSGPSDAALLGTNAWLTPGGRRNMHGWRLGFEDEAHRGAASAYFGGPGNVGLEGDGRDRMLALTMGRGFPHDPSRYVRPPLVQTAQVFRPHGTFAARVRFSTLEEGQRMIEAFWLYGTDHYRFCPPSNRDCDIRTPPEGTLFHVVEMDFEYNNWFLAEPSPHIHASAIRYREAGAAEDHGANSVAMSCEVGGELRDLCLDSARRSLVPDRWYLLAFRADSSRGTVEFEVVEDSDSPGRQRGVGRRGEAPLFRMTRGGPRAPLPLRHRFPVAMMLSIHYMGPATVGRGPACPQRGGLAVTCTEHSMEVDWVYHSEDIQRIAEVEAEVGRWRARRQPRVNTLGVLPAEVTPPHASASGNPARLVLRLDGPRTTDREASWTIRPASVRGVQYRMDVQIETACARSAAGCRPRIIEPRSPTFTVSPRPGETGMTIRARLFDPWWGYTQVSSPGSTWREWRIDFR